MDRQKPEAIVVGAGFAGLAAAYELSKAGWSVAVLESSDRVGGRVQTIHKEGYVIDTGAGTLFEGYKDYLEIAADLNLTKDIVPSSGMVATLKNGRPHLFDTTSIVKAGITTQLISWKSKLAALPMAIDLLRLKSRLDYRDLSKSAQLDTESVSEYCHRKLNAEILEYICEPMIRGLILSSAEKVSKLELLSGFLNIFNGRFINLLGGLNRFATELGARLSVQTNMSAEQVIEQDENVLVTWKDSAGNLHKKKVDAAVIATPLHEAARLSPNHRAELQTANKHYGYSRGLVVQLGFKTKMDCSAFVLQIPRSESEKIALIMLDHNKAPDRAPNGHALLSILWQQEEAIKVWEQADSDIIKASAEFIETIWPGSTENIDMSNLSRWQEVVPLTTPGSFKAQVKLKRALGAEERIQFAGDYLSSGGQNTAVVYGRVAARNLIAQHPQ